MIAFKGAEGGMAEASFPKGCTHHCLFVPCTLVKEMQCYSAAETARLPQLHVGLRLASKSLLGKIGCLWKVG